MESCGSDENGSEAFFVCGLLGLDWRENESPSKVHELCESTHQDQ